MKLIRTAHSYYLHVELCVPGKIPQHGCSQGGVNGHLPPLEIVSKNEKFLENLKLAAKFLLIHLIAATTVYLPVWHCTRARFTVLVSYSDEIAVRSCPLLCLQMQVAKLASRLLYCWSLLRNN